MASGGARDHEMKRSALAAGRFARRARGETGGADAAARRVDEDAKEDEGRCAVGWAGARPPGSRSRTPAQPRDAAAHGNGASLPVLHFLHIH